MATGTVKWFNYDKGYGFIAPADGGRDVFLHLSAVDASGIKNIDEGTTLSYDIADDKGKSSAVNIKLVG